MRRLKKDNMEWLEFDLLADIPSIRHAVFLRSGGSSQGCYASLNASYNVGDDPINVASNRKKIQELLNVPTITHTNQVHGCGVDIIESKNSCDEKESDSLITSTAGIGLMITHADCQSALFYDPKNHVIANVHAGWRGSVQNIYQHTITAMQKTFHTDPSNLLVCISPSLGPESAEFIHYNNELPEEFWTFQVKPNYFDFWAISENQLINAGILPHHIEIARLNTYSNPTDFFSYRRDKITGRNATCVALVNHKY